MARRPTGRRPIRERLAPWVADLGCAAILVILAAFHLRDPLGGRFPVSEEHDTLILQYPIHGALDRALAGGELPWWAPEAGNGTPLVAEGEAGALWPPNIVLFGLLPPYAAYALSLWLALSLLGIGTFGYARGLGAGSAGSLMAGASVMLSGFALGHEHHLSLLRTGALLPWLLWVAEAHVRRLRPGGGWGGRLPPATLAAGSAVVALQWLAGSPQMAHMSAIVLLLYLPIRGALGAGGAGGNDGGRRARTAGWGLGGAFVMTAVGMLVASIQILPSYLYVNETSRASGLSVEEATVLGFPPRDLLMFLRPRAFGTPFEGGFQAVAGERNVFWENVAYVGVIPLLLAVGAPAWRGGRLRASLLLGVALLGVAVALGRRSPVYHALHAVVPGMDRFRIPQRWLLVTALMLASAAALALTRLTELLARRWHRHGALGVVGAMVALAVFDVFRFGDGYYPTIDPVAVETPSAAARRAGLGEGLFAVPIVPREARPEDAGRERSPYGLDVVALAPHSLNVLWGIRSPAAYLGLPSSRAELLEAEAVLALERGVGADAVVRPPPSWAAVLGGVGVRYVTSYVPIVADGLVLVANEAVPGAAARLMTYRNERWLPRAALVQSARFVRGPRDAMAAMLGDPTFDPSRELLIEGGSDCGTRAAAEGREPKAGPSTGARVLAESAERIEIEAADAGGAWLFVAGAPLAGWSAAIDGRPAPLYPANLLGRAVCVPPGTHVVVMSYDPPGRTAGWILTGLGLALWLALVVLALRTPGRASEP